MFAALSRTFSSLSNLFFSCFFFISCFSIFFLSCCPRFSFYCAVSFVDPFSFPILPLPLILTVVFFPLNFCLSLGVGLSHFSLLLSYSIPTVLSFPLCYYPVYYFLSPAILLVSLRSTSPYSVLPPIYISTSFPSVPTTIPYILPFLPSLLSLSGRSNERVLCRRLSVLIIAYT